VLRGIAADPLNLIQVMLAKGCSRCDACAALLQGFPDRFNDAWSNAQCGTADLKSALQTEQAYDRRQRQF
jgi:hypothetical protein